MKVFAYIFLTLIIFMGCAASRYEKAEKLYLNNDYQELVESGLNCSDFSPECFQLKFYRTESYNKIGDINGTLEASNEAIDRIDADTPLSQINRLYSLRTNLIRESLPTLKNEIERTSTLRGLEIDYREIISILATRDKEEMYHAEMNTYQELLIESLLERMKLLSGRNLEILYDRIIDIIRDFDASLISNGYDKYYKTQADLHLVLREINDWLYQGKLQRGREELLNYLKKLYKEALLLRGIPLYQQGKSASIEILIKNIDSYMKELVI
jgi:hypothetical protein